MKDTRLLMTSNGGYRPLSSWCSSPIDSCVVQRKRTAVYVSAKVRKISRFLLASAMNRKDVVACLHLIHLHSVLIGIITERSDKESMILSISILILYLFC